MDFQSKISLYQDSPSKYTMWCGVTYLGEIYMESHGSFVWVPNDRGGYLDSEFLRFVADKLDELNKPFDSDLDSYFNSYKYLIDRDEWW